jgi:hypothetical protein
VGATLFILRAVRLAAITVLASAFAPDRVLAQSNGTQARPSLLAVKATVPADGVIDVLNLQGKTITGVLGNVTSEAIELTVRRERRTVLARDVRRIRWRQPDSWVTGAVIGGGIGAIPGIYYLISDPNECAGLCPEEYALVGIGALVGALVDKAITKKITVYEHPAARGAADSPTLTPVLRGPRRGVQVTVRF